MIHRSLFVCAVLIASTGAYAADFTLSSPTIRPNATLSEDQVFSGFGCTGKNRSPALMWTPGPKETKSYAITFYDPDAKTGSGWWHWVVYNIPANVHELAAGAGEPNSKSLPSGALQGRTDFGAHEFGGACPPKGEQPHHYLFTVYALKTEKLDVPPDASAAMIGFMIHANALGKATLPAKYGR